MRRVLTDLRSALRQLKNSPGYALVAIIILALGIGATTAIYTLLDQALLRALPVRNPQRLVQLNGSGGWEGHTHSYGGDESNYFSYPMYLKLSDRNKVFSGMLAATTTRVGVEWNKRTDLTNAELVSGNYFNVLSMKPALGRLLLPSDDEVKDGSPVVVLSFAYWQRQMGADPGVLNRTIGINGHPFTIVGVAAPGFHSVIGETAPAFFAPMTMKPEVIPGAGDLENTRSRWLNIIARLKPGMTVAEAQAGMQPLWHALRTAEFLQLPDQSVRAREAYVEKSFLTLNNGARGFSPSDFGVSTPFLIVLFMAVLVLLMACANVAGLMLVRAAGRVREMSVRYALGAKRSQIVRQLLMEGLVLGVAAGGLGLWLAPRFATLLERRILDQSTGVLPFSTQPDWRMLAFTATLCIAVSLLFSMAPAMQFWRPDVTPALKQQSPTVSGSSLRLQRVAVGVQIGLSVLLLMAAGLFVRTLYNLKSVNVGFETDHLVQFRVDPRMSGYTEAQMPALYRGILGKLRALPGARSVGATTSPVLIDWTDGFDITIAGYKSASNEDMSVQYSYVSSGYASTLGVPLLAGRTIADSDTATSVKVSVVNESFARHYFGGPRQALGRVWNMNTGKTEKSDIEIVGVVADSKQTGVDAKVSREVFLPYTQAAKPDQMAFYIRTAQDPDAAIATIRKSMHDLDPKLALSSLETMNAQVDEALDTQRTIGMLAICFGLLALLISAVGLYAVLAYATAQRTREIGLRIALGANRASIARMVLMDVLRLVAISVVVALPAAVLMSRWVRSQLYGVSGHDPVTMVAVVIAVCGISLLAALLPLRRAVGVDPVTALRYE